MSFCQYCTLKIKLLFYCSLCRNQFCSTNCLINHITKNHSKKIITSKNYSLLNQNDVITKISSNNQGYIINMKPYILTKEEFNLFVILTINNSEYQIGSGAFSKVYLGKHIPTNELYAIKKIIKKEIKTKIDSIEIIKREIEFHSKLYHKNITHLIATYENEENIYIILEYSNRGDLYKLIKKKKLTEEKICFNYFIQVLNAVLFLHENNLIHRDIKPENILLNEKNEIKLCDFGCCAESGIGNRTTFCGTYEYMAPEILKESSYNNSVDVWSLGILLFELSHGYTPFNKKYNGKKNQDLVFKDIIKNNFDFKKNMNFISEEYYELMARMIVYNPNKRIKLRDVFKSKLYLKFQFEKCENRKSVNISRKNTDENKFEQGKVLSERREKRHIKYISNEIEKVLSERKSINTIISGLRKSNIKCIEKENNSIYSNIKQNKKVNLNLKKIKSLSSIKSPENLKQKINKSPSIYNSYMSNNIKYQEINLYDNKILNNDDLIITIYKNTKKKLNINKGGRISTSKSSINIPLINSSNLNQSNNNDIQSINKINNNYTSNEEIKVFDNLYQDNHNDNNRKTKMKNVNGVNISSKLIDVLDIFNRVEKIKQSNEKILNYQNVILKQKKINN